MRLRRHLETKLIGAPLLIGSFEVFLAERGGAVVVALKTSSMGREHGGPAHLRAAEVALGAEVDLAPSVRLDPFYRSHYLVGGRKGGTLPPPAGRPAPRRPERRPGRRFPRRAR